MRFPIKMAVKIGKYIYKNKMAGKKRYSMVLMLEPTHLCNLACEGCGRIREYDSKAKKHLTLDECIESINECGAPVISVCGGEPLLYPNIVELLQYLKEQKKIVYLCTNGYFLEKKIDSLPNWSLLYINVHIDGLEETHDRIVNKKGTFKRAIQGIKKAYEKGYKICTNTTVFKNTDVDELIELFNFLVKIGVSGILVSPAYPYEAVETKEIFLGNEDIKKIFRELKKVENKFPFINTPTYFKYLRGEIDLKCSPWGCPTRNPDGWKGPCYLITDAHYKTFSELMEKTDWEKFENKQDPRCKYCMVHSGFEPTISIGDHISLKDKLELAYWSLFA